MGIPRAGERQPVQFYLAVFFLVTLGLAVLRFRKRLD
jgi:hypothetical protein